MMAQGGPLPELLWTLVATLGFALLFQLKGVNLPFAGLCGVVSWGGWLLIALNGGSLWLANFVAALVLTLTAEFIARLRKTITVAFLVPGLIPLVPGAQLYGAMEAAVSRSFTRSLDYAFEALAIATALVTGVLVVTVLVRMLGWHRRR